MVVVQPDIWPRTGHWRLTIIIQYCAGSVRLRDNSVGYWRVLCKGIVSTLRCKVGCNWSLLVRTFAVNGVRDQTRPGPPLSGTGLSSQLVVSSVVTVQGLHPPVPWQVASVRGTLEADGACGT